MLFPSLHAIKHIQEQHTGQRCKHQHNNQHEITHQHNDLHDCFTCGFNLSAFDISLGQFFTFSAVTNFSQLISNKTSYFTIFFKGSLFLQRGPPAI
jgi:hypothetical protein